MGKFEGQFKLMKKAYKASSKIMEKRMEKERPEDLEILKKVGDSSIIIVSRRKDCKKREEKREVNTY